MKNLFFICLVFFMFLPNCQKKEEPKVQTPLPSNTLAVQNRIMQLQDSVTKDPKNLGAWIELGNMLMDSSRFQEAIDAYRKALYMDRNNVNVRVDMGTCYRNIRQPDKAVEEYRRAIAINPDHPNSHRNLAVVLAFDLKNKKGAIKELEEYIRLAPQAPDAEKIRNLLAKLKV
jgi:tetratricopeptide (TPR) repeat protein